MNLSDPRDSMRWSLKLYSEAKDIFKSQNRLSESTADFKLRFKNPLLVDINRALANLKLSYTDENFTNYEKDDPTAMIPFSAQLNEGLLYSHIFTSNKTGDNLDSQVFNIEILRIHAEFTRFISKETYNKLG